MTKVFITAAGKVTDASLRPGGLGPRFGRMDLASRLAVLAVESLGVNFDEWPRDRVAVCLAAAGGSLATDVDFWNGRHGPGGPSPTLFAYTLPSAAIGEIAIRHQLTGPNLCFVGGRDTVLAEAAGLIRSGEADACVCVFSEVFTPATAALIPAAAAARACALFLRSGGSGRECAEFDRDIVRACDTFLALVSPS